MPDLLHLYEKSEPGADIQYNSWLTSSRADTESGNTKTGDSECNNRSSLNQAAPLHNSQNNFSSHGTTKETEKHDEHVGPETFIGTKKTHDDNETTKEKCRTTRQSARLRNSTVPAVVPLDSEASTRSNQKEMYIQRCNVETRATTWYKYKGEVIGDESFQVFELMKTAIPRDFSCEKLDEFIQFLKVCYEIRVLRSYIRSVPCVTQMAGLITTLRI